MWQECKGSSSPHFCHTRVLPPTVLESPFAYLVRRRADVLRPRLPKLVGEQRLWWDTELAKSRELAATNPNLLAEVVNGAAVTQLQCETLGLVQPPSAESFLMDVPPGIPCS